METAKDPSSDEKINKMCYIYAIEYYSPIKRDEISRHPPTEKP